MEYILEQSGPASSLVTSTSKVISGCKSASSGSTKVDLHAVASPLTGITSYAWQGSLTQGSATGSVDVALAAKGNQVLLVEYDSTGQPAPGVSFAALARDAAANLP